MSYESADTPDVSWFGPANALTRIFGFSFIASFFQGINGKMGSMGEGAGGSSSYIANSMRLFLLGTIIESGRRFFGWAMERFKPFREFLFISHLLTVARRTFSHHAVPFIARCSIKRSSFRILNYCAFRGRGSCIRVDYTVLGTLYLSHCLRHYSFSLITD